MYFALSMDKNGAVYAPRRAMNSRTTAVMARISARYPSTFFFMSGSPFPSHGQHTISHSAPNVTHKIKTGRGNSPPGICEKPRRVRARRRELSSNRFPRRHARRGKHFSARKCEVCPPMAGRPCAQRAAIQFKWAGTFPAHLSYFTGSPAAFLALISLRASL